MPGGRHERRSTYASDPPTTPPTTISPLSLSERSRYRESDVTIGPVSPSPIAVAGPPQSALRERKSCYLEAACRLPTRPQCQLVRALSDGIVRHPWVFDRRVRHRRIVDGSDYKLFARRIRSVTEFEAIQPVGRRGEHSCHLSVGSHQHLGAQTDRGGMRLSFGFAHQLLCRRATDLTVNYRKIFSYFETRRAPSIARCTNLRPEVPCV